MNSREKQIEINNNLKSILLAAVLILSLTGLVMYGISQIMEKQNVNIELIQKN